MRFRVPRWGVALALVGLGMTAAVAAERQATPPSSIRATDGFRVQRLRSAQADEGSWISMTFDPDGRIIVGLDDRGLARLTIDEERTSADFEPLSGTESFRHVRGVLFAHDSLYVAATNSEAVYRLRDLNGDGQFESQTLLRELPYQSRYGHGTNQIVLGPDSMLYVICGNDVVFPDPMATDSPYQNPQNDWLLPSPHDADQDNRVGYVARFDPEGDHWTVLAGGFRNPFDLAFNRDGELFTWDADMEWDVGLPWYRPTRLNHVIAGGEYGWRWGTGKWPDWYPDSLPTTLDTGLSSPTGMLFGHGSDWPQRYRDALFMADWQFGRILLVDLQPQGATYQATAEVFLEGGPLNVCDMQFGPDGALYFITGGRGSQSGLYRVSWTGDVEPPPVIAVPESAATDGRRSREIRQRLETYQRRVDPEAVDFVWPYLGDDDRWLRFSARVALENQPLSAWRDRLTSAAASTPATSPAAERTALLALARIGTAADQRLILDRLDAADWSSTATDSLLDRLRTLQLTIIRQGEPSAEDRQRMLRHVDPLFPHDSFAVNWLSQELLVALGADDVIQRSLDQIEDAATQEEQFQYAKTLMRVADDWDRPAAARMLAWLDRSRDFHGGKLVETTWQTMRADFEKRVPEAIRTELADEWARLDEPRGEADDIVVGNRPLVRQWTIDDVIDDVASLQPQDRSVENGRRVLAEAACLRCHRFGDRGGQTGPDLTDVGKRFDGRALLESILEPSRQVDPKYLPAAYLMSDGRVVVGRTVGVGKSQLTIEVDPLTGRTVAIDRDQIEESLTSPQSPMPAGLLDTFTRDELLDLVALLKTF